MKHYFCFTLLSCWCLVAFAQAQTNNNSSVLGTWDLEVTVLPAPSATNSITFSGTRSGGSFVDKNEHRGTWKLQGNRITWTYTSVPNLRNTFTGTVSDDFKEMKGTNEGEWQGKRFKGSWTGRRG
ncbi:MAG TPA: hypothetical protein VLL54_07585 [Pyrinomonadaceae bacterium]|nr:hypothetical protein [Pyrinomonadaceae bacterium]